VVHSLLPCAVMQQQQQQQLFEAVAWRRRVAPCWCLWCCACLLVLGVA
jgi:hypothetical protein